MLNPDARAGWSTPAVMLRGPDQGMLTALVFDERNNRYCYTVRLATLYSSEEEMRGGRFARYTAKRQEHQIVLQSEGFSGEQLIAWFGTILDWIGEHADDRWSCAVHMHHINHASVEFSFADTSMAVAFALVWI